MLFYLFKQKTAYDVRISDWSADVCASDLLGGVADREEQRADHVARFRRLGAGDEIAAFDLQPGVEIDQHALVDTGHDVLGIGIVAHGFRPQHGIAGGKNLHALRRVGGFRHEEALLVQGFDMGGLALAEQQGLGRSEEHTPQLQSPMRNSYAVFSLKKQSHKKSYLKHKK